MTDEQQVMLTSVEQYRFEMYQIPRLTPQEEAAIMVRAKAHDPEAKEALILCCLRYVAHIATHYAHYAKHDEYLDIVGVGNLAVMETLENALTKRDPKGFLFMTAKWTMISYCFYRSSLMPRWNNKREAIDCISLDDSEPWERSLYETLAAEPISPVAYEVAAHDYERLYQAIQLLSDKLRQVILRHYGLDGKPQESLTAISYQLSPNPKGTIAFLRHRRALVALQRILTMQMDDIA